MAKTSTHVRKGDTVEVIAGAELYEYQKSGDASQPLVKVKRPAEKRRGKVLQVFPAKNRVIVEGLRFIKRHTKKSQQDPEGGIIEREGPIHISNVRLVETKTEAKPKKGAKKSK